jgi:urease accessory protein
LVVLSLPPAHRAWHVWRRFLRGTVITQPLPIDWGTAHQVQPRAVGAVAVSVRADAHDITRLVNLRQSGALKLLFPRPVGRAMQAVIVNTAGGITGGDRFCLTAEVAAGASLTLTTQAAERAYRAQQGEVGQIENRLRVGAGGQLCWVPQELILYRRCALRRKLEIDLAPDARLLMVEPLVFGRAAMGERLDVADFRDMIRIRRAGALAYGDGMALVGDVAAKLAQPAIAAAAGALASLVYVAPDAPAHLAALRGALPARAGVSLIGPDMLVLRVLAVDSFELRKVIGRALAQLCPETSPPNWRL